MKIDILKKQEDTPWDNACYEPGVEVPEEFPKPIIPPPPPNFPEKNKPKEEKAKSPMAPTIGTWDPNIDMPLGGAKDD